MIFLCVLSESLGPTYEREHLYFEHWCNSLNADFSLHPFSCKSHDFIFLYGRKIPWHAYAASSLPRVGHLGWSRDLAVVKCCGTHGCASVCVVS